MRIDWELATIKANKRQKVEGKYLLALRSKIYDLEHDLSQRNKEIEQAKEKLTITEQSFNQLTEKFIASEKNMNINISDLKKKLAETKVTEKVDSVDVSLDRITDLEQKIVNKDNELMRVKYNLEKTNKEVENIKNHFLQNSSGKKNQIEKLRADLEITNREVEILKQELEQTASTKNLDVTVNRFKTEIEQKTKQIEINKKDLDHTILTKDSIIAKLEKDLESKINQIEELNNNINELYSQISNVKDPGVFVTNVSNESDLMKRIKELMDLKGFLTDKELEQLQ